ncbi:endodeoxyribonuclease [Vibrio phage VpaJT_1]|nr:endodeoxyribonuclease [Vibrio phage VpaJT_1]
MKPQSLGKWAVVDEESLSTEPNAALYSIGATMIDDLEIVDRFYVNIDPQSCLDVGLHQSQSTMDWWAKQGEAAQNVLLHDRVPIQTALQMWSDWIAKHGGKSVKLMGNGPCADNMWLNSAYKACGMQNPVPFWNDIDHRTLNWIGGKWLGVTKEDIDFKGVKHHAGDDAEHEARHAIMVLGKLLDALAAQEKAVLNAPSRIGKTTQETIINGANPIMNKQEFVLNNVTQAVRDGRVSGLVELAEQLTAVYDVANDSVRIEGVDLASGPDKHAEITVKVSEPVGLGQPVVVETPQEPAPVETVDTQTLNETETVTPPSAPADDTPRTHDDWGLPHSEDWHTSNHSITGNGNFKRKPGTNEQNYAHYMLAQVKIATEAETFKGPENWATVLRLSKYLDPVELQPTAPESAPETLQPQAESVHQAMHVNVSTEQPTPEAAPLDPVVETVASAPVGASEAAEVPSVQEMMNVQLALCKVYGAQSSMAKVVQDIYQVPTFMKVPDEHKANFIKMTQALIDQKDAILALDDQPAEQDNLIKTVLDSVTQ